jgi:anti-sigma28 factor (negative regulator of flagellin synthesis)
MRIPSNKPSFIDAPVARDKAVESPNKPAEGAAAPRSSEAALPSASLDRAVADTDLAAREFEQTISARLDQVKEQLRAGTYAVDYERLAQRMLEDGFGS